MAELNGQIHKVQASILYTLRHRPEARFSELMQPTGLTSDTFKFHLRKLQDAGHVTKTSSGSYTLTPTGKEFANNFDEVKRTTQKQAKVTIRLVVSQQKGGKSLYLFQQRRRNPYLDFWGGIGGPVLWGESFEDAAARELKKQTGLEADFTVRSFHHVRDFNAKTKALLEDKVFVVIEATNVRGELSNEWKGGHNEWMTVEEYKSQPKRFESAHMIIDSAARKETYVAQDLYYDPEVY